MYRKKILQLAIIALITVSLATIGISAEDIGTEASVDGGEVTPEDLEAMSETDKWAGFYGSIDVEFVLSDGDDNFFEWEADAQDVSGSAVYAVPEGIEITPDFEEEEELVDNEDDVNDVVTGHFSDDLEDGADSAEDTFTEDEDWVDETTAPAAQTITDDETEVHTWLFDADNNDPYFGTIADNDFDAFDGTENTDYQLLVAAESSTTYEFYIELDEED